MSEFDQYITPKRDGARSEFDQYASPEASMGDVLMGTPLAGLALGATDLLTGPLQLGMNVGSKISGALGGATEGPGSGAWMNQKMADIAAARERGRKASGRGGFDWARLTGGLGAGVGASQIVKQAVTQAPSYLRSAAQGGAGGAFFGGTAPETSGAQGNEYFQRQGEKAKLGGLTGLGLNAVVLPALRGAANLAEPVVDLFRGQKGADRLTGRHYQKILGEENIPPVSQALRTAKEIVPGSKPTAAEAIAGAPTIEARAAGSPLQALQKITASTPGGPSKAFGERAGEQIKARQAMLQPIAKTPADLAAAETALRKTKEQLYGDAYNVLVQAKIPKSILLNPYVKRALPDAMDLAKANNISPKENLTQFVHYIKIALDKQLSRTGDTALAATEKEAVANIRNHLLGWIEKLNPAYGVARNTTAASYKPINSMKVGQELEGALTAPSGGETPTTFMRKVADASKLIKDATGTPRQVFTPEQQKVVNTLTDDMKRYYAAQHPLQKTVLPGADNIVKGAIEPTQLGILSRPIVVANKVLSEIGKQNTEQLVDKLNTALLLNPQQLAAFLDRLPPTQQLAARRFLQDRAGALAGGLGAGQAVNRKPPGAMQKAMMDQWLQQVPGAK